MKIKMTHRLRRERERIAQRTDQLTGGRGAPELERLVGLGSEILFLLLKGQTPAEMMILFYFFEHNDNDLVLFDSIHTVYFLLNSLQSL